MGLDMVLGLFGGDKPNEKNIAKQVLRVKERYAQPEYRRAAMEKLLAWGTAEAIEGVLARFLVVVQSPHWDEEEKRWLVDELVERGDVAREALLRFLKRENSIAFAAKALRQLTDKEGYVRMLTEALQARPPEDHRSTQAKQDLVHALGEVIDAAGASVLLPYLDDHADDVSCAAIDVVEKVRAEGGFPRLVAIVTEEAPSARVLRHAAGVIARLSLPIDPQRPLQPAVLEDFVVKDGTLVRQQA